VGSDLAGLCTEAALEHIRQKVGLVVDVQLDDVDEGLLSSLAVTQADFRVSSAPYRRSQTI